MEVDTGAKGLIFLGNQKNPCTNGRRGWSNEARRKRTLNIFLHGLPFRTGQIVQATAGQRGTRKELDGAVIGTMGRQGKCMTFTEHLSKVMIFRGYYGKVGGFLG